MTVQVPFSRGVIKSGTCNRITPYVVTNLFVGALINSTNKFVTTWEVRLLITPVFKPKHTLGCTTYVRQCRMLNVIGIDIEERGYAKHV